MEAQVTGSAAVPTVHVHSVDKARLMVLYDALQLRSTAHLQTKDWPSSRRQATPVVGRHVLLLLSATGTTESFLGTNILPCSNVTGATAQPAILSTGQASRGLHPRWNGALPSNGPGWFRDAAHLFRHRVPQLETFQPGRT